MAGSASDGIHIIGAGGVLADTGMDIDMGTGMGIVMDTDMGIVMATMQEEERDTGQDIMQDPEILRKAMCIKRGQMEWICKPDSVPPAYAGGGGHLSLRPTRGRAGHPIASYSVLLRVEFT